MPSKTITNPNFAVLMLEVQDHLRAGWEIDENHYPVAHFVYYEVTLVKDEHAEVFPEKPKGPDNDFFKSTAITPPVKKAGRPPQNKAAQ